MPGPAGPPEADVVLHERRGPVTVLTLNRPERLNAWSDPLEDRYFDLIEDAVADPDVRAIVVTGAGRGFCAGADLVDLEAAGEDDDVAMPEGRRPRHFPLTIGKPLIAAVNGPAAGLGLVEALYCDVRFAAPDAKLTTAFTRRGLIAEYGIAWLLPRIVGRSKALDLLLSGRVVLGDEALSMGLVDRIAAPGELLQAAVRYAADLAAACSPTAMSVVKAQVMRASAGDFGAAAADADADALMLESFRRPDIVEGVASYAQKRAPAFAALAPPDAAL